MPFLQNTPYLMSNVTSDTFVTILIIVMPTLHCEPTFQYVLFNYFKTLSNIYRVCCVYSSQIILTLILNNLRILSGSDLSVTFCFLWFLLALNLINRETPMWPARSVSGPILTLLSWLGISQMWLINIKYSFLISDI